jgi:hypothetical protein
MTISLTSALLLRILQFSRSTTSHPLFTKGRSRRSPHNVNSIRPSMTWFISCPRRPRDRPIPLRSRMHLGRLILRSQSPQWHLLHLRHENLHLHPEQASIVQTLPPHILAPIAIASNQLRRQKWCLLRQNRRRLPKGINAHRACLTWPRRGKVGGPHRRHHCPNHSSPRPHRPGKAKAKVP